ncbi:MAG: SDR family NAD(P)-dependent oxidoreductase [Actinomycetota bacterium]
MDSLENKTAVVTGAASGMGLAFAHRFAQAGMNVVMSDIEVPPLQDAAAAVSAHGTQVISSITDVSDGDAMDELAALAFDTFDTVHVVCNNAGVAGSLGGDLVDAAAWKWVIDVNLFGVVHGHRVFLPKMIEQDEGHIINTASMAGHFPGHSAYTASKWGVVGITMGLHNELATTAPGVGVSCLCPGWVRTAIIDSDRNRPEWAAPNALVEPTAEQEEAMAFVRESIDSGMEPEQVAEMVHDAIVERTFWIFTDEMMVAMLADKHASIMENRNPVTLSLRD